MVAVNNLQEAGTLANVDTVDKDGALNFTLNLAGIPWRSSMEPVEPDDSFAPWDPETDAWAARPDVMNMYAKHTPENLQATLAALAELSYKPWSSGLTSGVDDAIVRSDAKEGKKASQKARQAYMEEVLAEIIPFTPENLADNPPPLMEANIMLVPEALYTEAVSDKETLTPNSCLFMRINNTESMELRWFADCTTIMSFSR